MRGKLRATLLVLAVISPIASLVTIYVTMMEERRLCEVASGSLQSDEVAQPALQRVFVLK